MNRDTKPGKVIKLVGKTIELAPQDETQALESYVDEILKALGHPEALVTDESAIGSFLEPVGINGKIRMRRGKGPWYEVDADPKAAFRNDRRLRNMSKTLGVPVAAKDLIIDIAKRMKTA